MSKNRLLFFFLFAGVILALILGVWVYRSVRGPSEAEVRDVLAAYIEKIAAGDLTGARRLMTPESRSLLRDPGTILGESVYRNLVLVSVDQVYWEDDKSPAADVVLQGPDTLKIMAKAGILFGERAAENGPAEDPDRLMEEIYTEILSRDDLPMLDRFCVIRFEVQNGKVLIAGDESLQRVLEGDSGLSLSTLEQIGTGLESGE